METGDTGDRDEPQIGDFAVTGDCRTAALVSRAGSIDWICLPDYSSSSLFAGILDSVRGGAFSIRPTGAFASKRRYVSTTPVLETTFDDKGNIIFYEYKGEDSTGINPAAANERNRLNGLAPFTNLYIKRIHYGPQTPYQRLLDSPDIPEERKAQLRAEHAQLDPFALKKSIEQKLRTFFTLLGNLNREATKP